MSQPSRCLYQAIRAVSQSSCRRTYATTPSWRQVTLNEQRRNYSRSFARQAENATTATAGATESSLQTEQNAAPLPTIEPAGDPSKIDWSRSFSGLSQEAFPQKAADILLAPIDPGIIEIKPDGICYLPEIHYRRILNRAFGPGAWGLAPRGETIVTDKAVTREYALVALGRLVSVARGEQDYFSKDGIPTASEGCKSNAMMRCCKDLGIASELWDPRFLRAWKAKHAREAFVEHQGTKKRTKIWLRKGDPVNYPYKETTVTPAKPA